MKTRKQKSYGIVFFIVCLLLSLAGCAGSGQDSVAKIQETGMLRAAVCIEGNPRFIQTEAEPEGVEAVLAKRIADTLGVELSIVPIASKEEGFQKIANDEADLVFGVFLNEADGYLYSLAYDKEPLYVITQRGDYSDCLEAFAGRNLAGSTTATMGITELTLQTSETPASDIQNKVIDGYICTFTEGQAILETDDTLQMQNLQKQESISYTIAMPEQSSRLLQGINIIINQDPEAIESTDSQTESE